MSEASESGARAARDVRVLGQHLPLADGREDVRPPDRRARPGRGGPGDQRRHRRLACRDPAPTSGRCGCCATAGIPTDAPRRPGGRRPPVGRPGGGSGPQPPSHPAPSWAWTPGGCGCCARSIPRSGAHAPDVEDPYYGDHDRLRGDLRRDRGGPARPARLGRRASGRRRDGRLMRRLPFLLRPGWIALALVVVAFTYLCLTVLAPWQLGKNTRTSRENNQIEASLSADPVPVTSFLPQQDSSAPDAQWRRVTATGRYLPEDRGAGATAGDRRRTGLRGAHRVRRRRRPDGSGEPGLRAPRPGHRPSQPSRRRRPGR